jgi:hypothetical protein
MFQERMIGIPKLMNILKMRVMKMMSQRMKHVFFCGVMVSKLIHLGLEHYGTCISLFVVYVEFMCKGVFNV